MFIIGIAVEKSVNVVDGSQRPLQVKEFLHFQTGVLDADAFQRWAHIKEVLVRKVLFLQNAHKLHRLLHLSVDVVELYGERHLPHLFLTQRAEA